jgi:hypothetical protein
MSRPPKKAPQLGRYFVETAVRPQPKPTYRRKSLKSPKEDKAVKETSETSKPQRFTGFRIPGPPALASKTAYPPTSKPVKSSQPARPLPVDERDMTADDIVKDPQLLSVLAAAELAREQCTAILDLIESHHDSSKDTEALEEELAIQKKALQSHLAKVRGLNRSAILNVRKTKQETADARQEVDTLHLQLQNLKYEQSHLRRQIALCENFECVHPFVRRIMMVEWVHVHAMHTISTTIPTTFPRHSELTKRKATHTNPSL